METAPLSSAAGSLTSLPDDLILRCLEPIDQYERYRTSQTSEGSDLGHPAAACRLPPSAPAARTPHSVPAVLLECRLERVALVSKRFRELCLAPQLLRQLRVFTNSDDGAAGMLQRTASALQFLTAHAAHVHDLEMHINDRNSSGTRVLTSSQQRQLEADVAGCLAACAAAAGALQELRIDEPTPLRSVAWLPALQQLQLLELGSPEEPLRLPAAASKLTALKMATLRGAPLVLEGRLPPGLTCLCIRGSLPTCVQLPHQVSTE